MFFRSLEFQHSGLNNRKSGSKRVVQVRWERPQMGWACLNTDDAAAGNLGQAGCGGLIRNEHGEWLCGFFQEYWVWRQFYGRALEA